jgi:hypothetical protein
VLGHYTTEPCHRRVRAVTNHPNVPRSGPGRTQPTKRAGVPGLEPRLTEPESGVLPITPYPIGYQNDHQAIGRISPQPEKTLPAGAPHPQIGSRSSPVRRSRGPGAGDDPRRRPAGGGVPGRPQRTTTGLDSVPIPSTSTSTLWPADIGAEGTGVPVSRTSPGNRVMAVDT